MITAIVQASSLIAADLHPASSRMVIIAEARSDFNSAAESQARKLARTRSLATAWATATHALALTAISPTTWAELQALVNHVRGYVTTDGMSPPDMPSEAARRCHGFSGLYLTEQPWCFALTLNICAALNKLTA
jgi:hypothetical protein